MKTLAEKIEICKSYGNAYSTSYGYTMGGETRLIITSKGKEIFNQLFNHKEYYSGRGTKYNKSIKHDYIEERITLTEFNKRYKKANEWFKQKVAYEKSQIKEAKLLKKCDFETLEKHLLKNLTIIKNNEYTEDERYWLNGYFGCGVYRLFFENGRIAASLKGGYGQSMPYNKYYAFDYGVWVQFVNSYVKSKIGNDLTSAKADGSGTYFYLREDHEEIATNNYLVPSSAGGMHMNYEVV